eukprot:TRINITY_DN21294_c0_g1_i1.p2 TRINITY_DN21294_c0_g1~~TRINITY_DN21294_c0_g1_i1.p2  ORF type:complete len:142 (+),score=1.43 TRINITY_DN21294_c0_g1_i1:334-759(+)
MFCATMAVVELPWSLWICRIEPTPCLVTQVNLTRSPGKVVCFDETITVRYTDSDESFEGIVQYNCFTSQHQPQDRARAQERAQVGEHVDCYVTHWPRHVSLTSWDSVNACEDAHFLARFFWLILVFGLEFLLTQCIAHKCE